MVALAVTLGAPPKASQEVPQEAIVAFHGRGLGFGLGMKGLRNHVGIRVPIITDYGLERVALNALP